MPQFNIYKIPQVYQNSLYRELPNIAKLENSTIINDFKVDFYLSYDKNEIWWIDYYQPWISEERKNNPNDDLQNKNYYGAVVLTKKDICYVISLGKLHFYIKKFCQPDFGIQFAQRVINKNNVTLLNANSFGGNKRKSINSFAANSSLEPESGEAIMSLKGETLYEKKLGSFINCSDSISITLEECKLTDLPDLIDFIENSLIKKARFDIPTSRKVNDHLICQKLDNELAKNIIQYSHEVNFSEILHSDGIGFLTRGDFFIKYLVLNRLKIELNNELDFAKIKSTFLSKGVDLTEENVLNIKVKVQNQFGQELLKPIKFFLDYINPEKYYLNEGFWHSFNQKYLDFIDNSIDLLNVVFKPEYNDSYEKYNNWAIEHKIQRADWYFEKYFNEHIMTNNGFINTDRKVNLSNDDQFRRYKLEIADSVKEDLLVFVKKGTPQKLNYVIDQSLVSFKYLQENDWHYNLDGRQIKVKKMCLVLLFERGEFKKITEVESLIFKMKLSEWRKRLINSNIEPLIWCSFISPTSIKKTKTQKQNKKAKTNNDHIQLKAITNEIQVPNEQVSQPQNIELKIRKAS